MEMVERRIDKATKAAQSGDKKYLQEAETSSDGSAGASGMRANPPRPVNATEDELASAPDLRFLAD